MKIIDKIDKYFYDKTFKKEFYYALVLLVFLIGFIIYYYIFPLVKDFDLKSKEHYNNLVTSIQEKRIRLNVLKAKDIQSEKKLQLFKKQLIELRKEKMFFDELTSLMDFAKFNQAKWANFVQNIISDAKHEGLKVKLVENDIYNGNEQDKKKFVKLPSNILVKKMSIGLNLNGNYINFIHFIYKYENRRDLIRVEKMEVKDRHDYYVKFTLYGYKK